MGEQNGLCSSCADGRCEHCKATPRDSATLRAMRNRLSRIVGQLNGISKMLDENRYCGDILNQVAAAESALSAFAHVLLKDHMKSCVVEQLRAGNDAVLDELSDLIKRLN